MMRRAFLAQWRTAHHAPVSVFRRYHKRMVNLADLEEMVCPKCRRPFIGEPVEGKPNAYTFIGCRCDQTEFYLPETVGMVGAEGG